jgi:dephospho-CoA kinase
MLRRLGVPVHESDACVHRLLAPGGAAEAAVAVAFPQVVREGRIDRALLGAHVFAEPAALARLEAIVHPLVGRETRRFLARAAARRAAVVVLDVPLLFETGGEARVDATICVTAPPMVQRPRVLARPGMTEAKLDAIQSRQMPDREKRRRASFVVPTGLGKLATLRALQQVLTKVGACRGRHWPPGRGRGFA